MEFSFMLSIHATKEKVWEFYANINQWYIWEEDLKNITLAGDFVTGSAGTMELEGMPVMHYVLTDVEPFKAFWDKTETPFGPIFFGHEIAETDGETVTVRHTVRLKSDSEEHLDFLKQVFADVPNSLFALKSCVEK